MEIDPAILANYRNLLVNTRETLAHNQFQDFIHLAADLLNELDHHVDEDVLNGMQNPLHTVREILDSMIKVGFPSDAAGALSITALTRGYGHEVCTTLNWLLDQVLKRRRFKWRRPEYPQEGFAIEAEVDMESFSEMEALATNITEGMELIDPDA